jgi:hypothetical protein
MGLEETVTKMTLRDYCRVKDTGQACNIKQGACLLGEKQQQNSN